jgi:hypothetical protein
VLPPLLPLLLQGVWSLRQTSMDAYDKYLVLTFVGETRLLAINQVGNGGGLQEGVK